MIVMTMSLVQGYFIELYSSAKQWWIQTYIKWEDYINNYIKTFYNLNETGLFLEIHNYLKNKANECLMRL